MGKTFNMVGGGGGLSPDLPIGSRINVTSDLGTTITASKGDLSYTKNINWDARLPSEYQEVSYIQSTGTQWIDTGVTPSTDITINAKIKWSQPSYDACPFGVRNDTSQMAFLRTASSSLYAFVGTSSLSKGSFAFGNNDLSLQISDSNAKLLSNGVVQINSSFNGTVPTSLNIYLFACNNNGTTENQAHCTMVDSQIIKGGLLVRDYIPCYRKSDFVAGMYDLVNDTFYTNCGTGEDFICGASVRCLPSGYTQYDCITSSGTQWIDTGIYPYGQTRTIAGITKTSTNYGYFFGANNSADTLQYVACDYTGGTGYLYYMSTATTFTGGISGTKCIEINKNKLLIDGVVKATSSASSSSFTTRTQYSLLLFAGNSTAGTARSKMTCSYNYARVIEDSVLLRDFVPCTDSNNIVGMYDIVNGVFYDNDGTGTFTLGDRVTPANGTCTFTTHFSGQWTIKAEKSGESAIYGYVSVNDDDTDYDISLFWNTYLIKNGVIQSFAISAIDGNSTTSLTSQTGYQQLNVTGWSQGCARGAALTDAKINLTDYSILKCELSCDAVGYPAGNPYTNKIGINSTSTGTGDAITAEKTVEGTTKAIIALDISSFNSEYYVGVWIFGQGVASGNNISIYNLWLE